jgi:hypothetical protein
MDDVLWLQGGISCLNDLRHVSTVFSVNQLVTMDYSSFLLFFRKEKAAEMHLSA